MELGTEQAREGLRLNPDNVIGAENLMAFLVAAQRYEDAHLVYRKTLDRKLDDDALHIVSYGLDFVQGNAKGMGEQAAWFETRPELQNEILGLESDTEAYAGHHRLGHERSRGTPQSLRCGRTTESRRRSGRLPPPGGNRWWAIWKKRSGKRPQASPPRLRAGMFSNWRLSSWPAAGTSQRLVRWRRSSPSNIRSTPLCSLTGCPRFQTQIALSSKDAQAAIEQSQTQRTWSSLWSTTYTTPVPLPDVSSRRGILGDGAGQRCGGRVSEDHRPSRFCVEL